MKSFAPILSVKVLTALIAVIISACSTLPVSSIHIPENGYDPLMLQTVEVFKNLEFKAGNNENYLYFSVIIKSDSLNKKYSRSILNLWLNSEGLHLKNSGFQFPLKRGPHPFIKNQFSSLANWGGFKSLLTDTQSVRLADRIKDYEKKILYFNEKTRTIDLIDADGTMGFKMNRKFVSETMTFNFIIPLNADGEKVLGVTEPVEKSLAIGFEILPDYNINRPRVRSGPALTSPGIGSPTRSTGRSPTFLSQPKLKPEIYWLNLKLVKGSESEQ